jgi:hypothetical protein
MQQKQNFLSRNPESRSARLQSIKDEKDFVYTKNRFLIVESGKEPATHYPKFPKIKKLLYTTWALQIRQPQNNEIKGVSVKIRSCIEVPAGNRPVEWKFSDFQS